MAIEMGQHVLQRKVVVVSVTGVFHDRCRE